jgi:hypothetical protein
MIASPLDVSLTSYLSSLLFYLAFSFILSLKLQKWSPLTEHRECLVKVSRAIVIRRTKLTCPDGIHVDMNHLKSGEVK